VRGFARRRERLRLYDRHGRQPRDCWHSRHWPFLHERGQTWFVHVERGQTRSVHGVGGVKSLLSFAMHPRWAANYFMHEKFELPQLKDYVKEGSNISVSVGDYFSTMLDQSMNWQDAADVRKKWGKQFCLKGIMSIADAKRAVDIGATAIMVSNHGGRQLDGSRSPFDQLAEIVDAVGDRIDVICDGGITRGTHVLKAFSVGAKACSGGRLYLYALAAAGQAGVERALENLRAEIERDMKLMGCRSVDQLSRDNLRFR